MAVDAAVLQTIQDTIKTELNNADFRKAIVDEVQSKAEPLVAEEVSKVNPYFILGFMMLLTLVLIYCSVAKYIDQTWFALAVGIWIQVPGMRTTAA